MNSAADVCVIGAGAGGAVIAAELAEGGAEVIVLEQGPEHDPDGFTARPPEMLARLYRDGGQTVTLGNPPIGLPLGRGIGGTTLVNSGTCFRTPPHVLARWHDQHGLTLTEQAMAPYFERVERALSVAEVAPELAGRNAEIVRRGAERLGWSHGYLRRNAKGCVGSGVCAFGCPTSAKQHTGITYIPRAKHAGAQILTGTTARRIETHNGRATARADVDGTHRRPHDRRRRGDDPHSGPAWAQRPRAPLTTARPEPLAAPRDGRDRADGRDRRHGPGRSPELLRRRVRGRGDHVRERRGPAVVRRDLAAAGRRRARRRDGPLPQPRAVRADGERPRRAAGSAASTAAR